MNFAVTVAEVNMNSFVFELLDVRRRRVRKNQMADVDVGAHTRMAAFVDKTNHGVDVVEQAQTERLQFESNIDILLLSIIAETPTGFDAPLPLGRCRNDFALPDVFAQNEQNVLSAPGASKIDEFLAPINVKFAHRIIEIDHNRVVPFRFRLVDPLSVAVADATEIGRASCRERV